MSDPTLERPLRDGGAESKSTRAEQVDPLPSTLPQEQPRTGTEGNGEATQQDGTGDTTRSETGFQYEVLTPDAEHPLPLSHDPGESSQS